MTRVIAPADADDSVSEALETRGGDWPGPAPLAFIGAFDRYPVTVSIWSRRRPAGDVELPT